MSITDILAIEMIDEREIHIRAGRRPQHRKRWWIGVIVVIVFIGAVLGLSFVTKVPVTSANQRSSHSFVPPPYTSLPIAMNRPEALAVASNGSILIANQGTNQILSRAPNGTLTVVAGTGKAGYSGDGGSALNAELKDPSGIAVAENGIIYVADSGNNRVRAISPSGTITTIAGNGNGGNGGVGGPAIGANVSDPVAVALGGQGQIYIADMNGLQQVSPSGVLTTLVPSGSGHMLTIKGKQNSFSPTAVAVGGSGDLYVADFSPKLLVELTPTGQVVNSWSAYVTVAGLSTAPNGSVVVANYGFSIDKIVNGHFITLVSFKLNSIAGLSGGFRPSGVAVSRTGQIYAVTDGVNGGADRPALVAISTSAQVHLLTEITSTN